MFCFVTPLKLGAKCSHLHRFKRGVGAGACRLEQKRGSNPSIVVKVGEMPSLSRYILCFFARATEEVKSKVAEAAPKAWWAQDAENRWMFRA